VAKATYAVGDTDYTSQVEKMKSAGAQIVVITALPNTTGPIVGTAASLGYTPTYLLQGPSFVEQLITTNGTLRAKATPIAAALAKSTYVMNFATPWNTPVAGMRAMLKVQRKYAPSEIPSIYFTWGYAQTKVIESILRKGIENGDLSRQGIVNARNEVGTIHTGGLTPPVAYKASLGPPSTSSIISRINPNTEGFLTPIASGITSPLDGTLG
jgi:ABC-type branched-subunit amino acid transport system substrate-binding protein